MPLGSSAQQLNVEIGLEGEVEIVLAARPQKITFGEMRDEMRVRSVLVCCPTTAATHPNKPSYNPSLRLTYVKDSPVMRVFGATPRPRASRHPPA
jgi:hypothetical protein